MATITDTVTENKQAKAVTTVPAWTLLLPLAVGVLLFVVAAQQPDGRLHMWVLNVGQGDAIILKTPKGHTAVIDGGPAATPLLEGVGAHVPFWQHSIDLLVLTVPRQDRMMGLVELLSHYRVGQVIQTEFTATVGVQGQWLSALKAHSVPVHYAHRGDAISFEDEPDLAIQVLNPATPTAPKASEIANSSIVLKVTYGREGILLESDAQAKAEAEMIAHEPGELASVALKVGNYGSDKASSQAFLSKVRPSVAIISVDPANRYGYPAQSTLDGLHEIGAQIYRTDRNGTIEIIAEKDKMWVHTEQ